MWYQGMIRYTKTIGSDVRSERERDETRKTVVKLVKGSLRRMVKKNGSRLYGACNMYSMHCVGREGCEELRMREDSRKPILKLQLGGDYEEKD
ncbi:hypothetical protein BHYA_0050g00300 [Botrytis hyacinthi]|uniref:Uncharacterized protein n=1 Tax=Botrytis hyacinthi TaxID=278943 RepID=A0A4Z1GRT1_9HELO|nr:hypothetical protein BHYA_0050g00300 [Botrytis hyacinthi]